MTIAEPQLVSRSARRALALAALALTLGCIATLVANAAVAQRIAGALLPSAADLDYTRNLLCYLAIAGIASCALLGLGWRWFTGSRAALGRWVLVASLTLYVGGALSFWWYVNDDAGISFTFARNLAEGHGLVFNLGQQPVEGYSNTLWVLLLAGAHCCGLDIIWTAKALGLALGAGCLLLIWRLVRGEHPLCWLALPLIATNAAFIIWTSSGLESALHAFLLTGTAVLLAKPALTRPAALLLATALALLVLTRPEGMLFALLAAAYLGLRALWQRRSLLTPIVVFLIPALTLAALIAFRRWYFDDVLPNTYYAKATDTSFLRVLNPFSGGWRYTVGAFSGAGWLVALVPVLLVLLRPRQWSGLVAATLALIAGQLFFVISVGGDWMGEFRFIAPIVPVAAVLVALGLRELAELLAGTHWQRQAALVCTVPVVLMVLGQVPRLIRFAQRPTTSLEAVADIGSYFVDLAHQAGIQDPTLLHHDAGGTSYVARIHLIDLGGLCDRTIAKHWRDRDRMRHYIFDQRRPMFIYSGPVFARKIGLESFPEFHSDYLPLPPAPSPALDGYIRRVRADLYPRLFGNRTANMPHEREPLTRR